MRIVRSLYARSKLEKYHESTNVYRQKNYLPKAKVRLRDKVETKTKPQKLARRVCSHEKKGLRSRQKRASPHEKKGFTSRAQTPHLDFHSSIACFRAHVFVIFAFLIQALSTLKDEPLGVVLDGKRVGANMCGNWVEFVPGILGVKCTKIGGRY